MNKRIAHYVFSENLVSIHVLFQGVSMIEIFEGRLGGGKTLYAVERMVKYLASGGSVSTNIVLNIPAVTAFLLKRYSWALQDGQYILLQDEEISMFHKFTPAGLPERPSLVVIDEAHIWLNARDWNKTHRELLTFLTQSRKCFTDIIFISQSALNIDKQIMRLVQYIWRFRDMQKFRIAALGFKWPLPQFLRVQFDQDGKTVLDRQFVLKDPVIYGLYNSFDLLRKFPRLEGAKVKFDGKVKKSKRGFIIKSIIVVILLAVGMGYFAWKKLSSNIGAEKSFLDIGASASVEKSAPVSVPDDSAFEFEIILHEFFRGVIEDSSGRKVITDEDTYLQGELCRIGKVLFCYPEKIMIAGFDGRPHMVMKKKYRSKPVADSKYSPQGQNVFDDRVAVQGKYISPDFSSENK